MSSYSYTDVANLFMDLGYKGAGPAGILAATGIDLRNYADPSLNEVTKQSLYTSALVDVDVFDDLKESSTDIPRYLRYKLMTRQRDFVSFTVFGPDIPLACRATAHEVVRKAVESIKDNNDLNGNQALANQSAALFLTVGWYCYGDNEILEIFIDQLEDAIADAME